MHWKVEGGGRAVAPSGTNMANLIEQTKFEIECRSGGHSVTKKVVSLFESFGVKT